VLGPSPDVADAPEKRTSIAEPGQSLAGNAIMPEGIRKRVVSADAARAKLEFFQYCITCYGEA